jgi:hypothetical protein
MIWIGMKSASICSDSHEVFMKSLLIGAVAILALPAFGQDCPNLTGTYELHSNGWTFELAYEGVISFEQKTGNCSTIKVTSNQESPRTVTVGQIETEPGTSMKWEFINNALLNTIQSSEPGSLERFELSLSLDDQKNLIVVLKEYDRVGKKVSEQQKVEKRVR